MGTPRTLFPLSILILGLINLSSALIDFNTDNRTLTTLFNCTGKKENETFQHPTTCNKLIICSANGSFEVSCPKCPDGADPKLCPGGSLWYKAMTDNCEFPSEVDCKLDGSNLNSTDLNVPKSMDENELIVHDHVATTPSLPDLDGGYGGAADSGEEESSGGGCSKDDKPMDEDGDDDGVDDPDEPAPASTENEETTGGDDEGPAREDVDDDEESGGGDVQDGEMPAGGDVNTDDEEAPPEPDPYAEGAPAFGEAAPIEPSPEDAEADPANDDAANAPSDQEAAPAAAEVEDQDDDSWMNDGAEESSLKKYATDNGTYSPQNGKLSGRSQASGKKAAGKGVSPQGKSATSKKGKSVAPTKGKSAGSSKGKSVASSKGKSVAAPKGKSVAAPKGKSAGSPKGKSIGQIIEKKTKGRSFNPNATQLNETGKSGNGSGLIDGLLDLSNATSEKCDPLKGKLEGYCTQFKMCNRKSKLWERLECPQGLYWNPEWNEDTIGGSCDQWGRLKEQTRITYENDLNCIYTGRFFEMKEFCSATFLYHPDGADLDVREEVRCPPGLVFSDKAKTCDFCENVNNTDTNEPCDCSYI